MSAINSMTSTSNLYPRHRARGADGMRGNRHLQALLPLFQAGQAQEEEQGLRRLFRVLWDIVSSEVGADGLLLTLSDGELQPKYQATFGLRPQGHGAGLIEIVARWVNKTSQPLFLSSGAWLYSQWLDTMTESGLSAVLGLPLIADGRSRGAMILLRAAPQPAFHRAELDFLYVLGCHAAVALRNIQLGEEIQKGQLQMERLRELSLSAQEGERHRLCNDLHDGVAQWLTAASYHLQASSRQLQANPVAAQKLLEVEDIVERSLRELRWVMADLRPQAIAQLGLSTALLQLLCRLNRDSGIHCHLDIGGEILCLPLNHQVTIYRVVQEALNNVRKHSRATGVKVHLHFNRGWIKGDVEDEGQGFDLAQLTALPGSGRNMGIAGMMERAEAVGGSLQIQSRPGKGTRVAFCLPLSINGKE